MGQRTTIIRANVSFFAPPQNVWPQRPENGSLDYNLMHLYTWIEIDRIAVFSLSGYRTL